MAIDEEVNDEIQAMMLSLPKSYWHKDTRKSVQGSWLPDGASFSGYGINAGAGMNPVQMPRLVLNSGTYYDDMLDVLHKPALAWKQFDDEFSYSGIYVALTDCKDQHIDVNNLPQVLMYTVGRFSGGELGFRHPELGPLKCSTKGLLTRVAQGVTQKLKCRRLKDCCPK